MNTKDLSGQKFNRLIVIGYDSKDKRGHSLWLCQCDCGKFTLATKQQLVNSKKKSCGCIKKETSKPPVIIKHNMSRSRLYQVWKDMKGRCERPTSPRYYTHGGRGIKVCAEWKEFAPFSEWAMANGYQENLTLDRIDNDGDYCPENCRWATQKEQANNRRTNCFIEYNGKKHTLKEWSVLLGINYSTLVGRINKRGWSVDKAFNKK